MASETLTVRLNLENEQQRAIFKRIKEEYEKPGKSKNSVLIELLAAAVNIDLPMSADEMVDERLARLEWMIERLGSVQSVTSVPMNEPESERPIMGLGEDFMAGMADRFRDQNG